MSLRATLNYKFEYQSAQSKHWFKIGIEWLYLKFSTRESDFFEHLFQNEILGEINQCYYTFTVTVGDLKTPENVDYHEGDPVLKYQQHGHSTCIFGTLASGFFVSCENVAEYAIYSSI